MTITHTGAIMTYSDAIKRAVATFLFGALSTPISAAVFDLSAWKVAAASGLAAVLNLVYRAVEAYLEETEEV
jgi:hypothetical protein